MEGGRRYTKDAYIAAEEDRDEAKKRIKKLLENAHAEALELNEEYDRLLAEGDAAAIERFKRERLGMSKEEETKK